MAQLEAKSGFYGWVAITLTDISRSPLTGAVLCMGGAPMTKVVLKVPLLCSTPCSFFASQPHAIYSPCVIFRIYNVLYEVFDLCYVKSLLCVV